MANPLDGYWGESGLERGDIVLFHSSMARTFRYLLSKGAKPDPRLVIDSILDQIGAEGTVLFPLFNFDFPVKREFSMLTTPSQMGVITEFSRQNYPGSRTGHPIYSFYAIGALSEEFKDLNNRSGYGPDSPFAKLLEMDGKIASVDLDDQHSMTMYHFVEEKMEVDYRYFKSFVGNCEDLNGVVTSEEYILYVRDLERGVVTNLNRMGEILWSEGLYIGNRPGVGNGLRTIQAESLVSRVSKEIVEGRAIETLYSIE
jgi:aminoglycoside 3-N-acetyltransferase